MASFDKIFFFLSAWLLFSCVFATYEETKKTIINKCKAEHDAPDSAVQVFYTYSNPENVKDHKCFIKCIYKSFDLLTAEGFANEQKIFGIMERVWKTSENINKNRPVLQNCLSKAKSANDSCTYSYDILKCFIDGRKLN